MGRYLRHIYLFHLILLIALFLFTGANQQVFGQSETDTQDSAKVEQVAGDSIGSNREDNSFLESKVDYNAEDSMIIDMQQQKAYLYGNAIVTYEELKLEADYIEIDFNSNLVMAKGLPDSTGEVKGKPLFTEKGQQYEAGQMTYNFKTKKGKINDALTQQGDGYIHGQDIKKESDNIFFIKNGRYTTCNKEDPHFYILASKLKVINNEKIVTGPANMWISDIPTPLAIPFGFFPNKRGRQSGVMIPSYGFSPERGYFLQNGGLYLGINDNFDASIRGDIYSNLSWSTNTRINYKKRYKRKGSLDIQYTDAKDGDPETPDFTRRESFFVSWNHSQDPKAFPNSNFRAKVNFGSTDFYQNTFNSDINNIVQNDFASNISYTKNFANSPFNLTVNGSHSQNNRQESITATLPQATLTMSRIFPFKRKVRVGSEKWYERIGFSYSTDMKNTVTTSAANFNLPNIEDKMRYGVRHNIPISTSIKAGHLTISPNININEVWQFQTIRKQYDSELENNLRQDTLQEFRRFGNYSASMGLATKLYGMYSFGQNSKVEAVRHTFTPNVSLQFTPDFSSSESGYFDEYQVDSLGNTQQYSVFEGGIYGAPNQNQRAVINFDLQNNVEMKYKSENDSGDVEFKKAPILEMLSANWNYNLLSDSLNWSPVNLQLRTTIAKIINIRGDLRLDPYALNENDQRINEFQWDENQRPFRITQASANVGFQFQSSNVKNRSTDEGTEAEKEDVENNPDAYVNFNIPWRLSVNYNIQVRNTGGRVSQINSVNFNGEVNLTENWRISFRSGYDIENKQLNITSFDVYRDLHCWQIRFNIIPFGTRQSYNFNIGVKAPMLQDLKLQRKRSWFDNQ